MDVGGGGEDVDGDGAEGDKNQYHYDDWDVDKVDLDFKTVSDLSSLLLNKNTHLSFNLYKVSDQIDANLRKQLKSLNSNPQHFTSLSTSSSLNVSQPSSSTFINQEYSSPSSIDEKTLSSTDSIQETSSIFYSFSNQFSTLTQDPEASLLGSVNTFPFKPTDESVTTDFSNIFIHIFFLVIFLGIAFFVTIQCSHLAVYIYRESAKRRAQGGGLTLYSGCSLPIIPSSVQGTHHLGNCSNTRSPHDVVVEVDSSSNIPHHHRLVTPQSPISIIQNSPIYSPVKDSPISPSSSSSISIFMFPQEEDRTSPDDRINTFNTLDRDEGIESEEEIDRSAFKQLILQNLGGGNKSHPLLSNCQDKENLYEKMNAESSNHGRLIHMLSPCSDMNTNTSRLSPSPLHKQSTTGGLAQVKRKVDTIGNTQECLI